jgi:septum formation protein
MATKEIAVKILLASSSPRRLELLKALGHEVEVKVPDITELTVSPDNIIYNIALANARKKADFIYNNFGVNNNNFILAADTIVVCESKIFNKPTDNNDAARILSELSGRVHEVVTAFCLINSCGDKRESMVFSKVSFRTLSCEEIQAYIACGESLDKASAYGIQGAGAALIASINGSITNIIGLPLTEVLYAAEYLVDKK